VPGGRQHELVRDPWLTASFGLAAMEWETSTRLLYALTPRAPEADRATVLHALEVDGRGAPLGPPVERAVVPERGLADLRFDAARAHLLAVQYKSERDVFVGELRAGDTPSLERVERVTFSEREERMSSWSRDGERLYLVAETPAAHAAVSQSLRGYPETLHKGHAWTSWPTQRSDGALYLWQLEVPATRGGDARPRLLRVDGAAPVELLRAEDSHERSLRVPPPSGWRIRCAARAPRCFAVHAGATSLRVFELERGEVILELAGDMVDARPSPDGQRLLVVHNRRALAVVDLAGRELERMEPASGCGYSDATWLPDGSAVLAAAICLSSAETFQIVHLDASRRPTRLWSAPSVMALDLHVSPDGRKLAFTQETFSSDVVLRPWRR
jgi:dipeptidyl aminopeptidase/acylaminoacyl peptidase